MLCLYRGGLKSMASTFSVQKLVVQVAQLVASKPLTFLTVVASSNLDAVKHCGCLAVVMLITGERSCRGFSTFFSEVDEGNGLF